MSPPFIPSTGETAPSGETGTPDFAAIRAAVARAYDPARLDAQPTGPASEPF